MELFTLAKTKETFTPTFTHTSAVKLTPEVTSVPTTTATSEYSVGSKLTRLSDSMVMAYVPAGNFEMGGKGGDIDEKPEHSIYLDAFWMDQTEATNARYAKCVQLGACTPPQRKNSETRSNYYGNPEYDDYPVIDVDWNQANQYCLWAGARLPTEAEWEKAARGTDGRLYTWGNAFDGTKANFCDKNCSFFYANHDYNDGYADTAPVGAFNSGRSEYGIFNLAGNVWEWVMDIYDSSYYFDSPSMNPLGPTMGEYRVLRGGSWFDFDHGLRSANRSWERATSFSNRIGFRCARSAP